MYQVDQGAYWQAQAMNWGPRILIALLILVATWLVARAVKWALQKAISRTPALQKHTPGNQHETIGHQLGTPGTKAAGTSRSICTMPQPYQASSAQIFSS